MIKPQENGLLFLVLGIFPTFYKNNEIQSWLPTQATLTQIQYIKYHTLKSSNATYQTRADYHYQVDGENYTNNQVSIFKGYDSNSFQRKLYRILEDKYNAKQTITIYYHPLGLRI